MALVEAVCVVHEVRPDDGRVGATAIDKREVAARVAVHRLGLDGDRQLDADHHGGPDKAVYAYAGEDASWWAGELDRDLAPGVFGENLRTTGLDVTGAVVGERWQVGSSLVLEVTEPRVPCATFQRWMDEPRWVRRFTEHGAPGAYLRVVQEGDVGSGDRVEVVHRPAHGVTVGACFTGLDAVLSTRLLDAEAAGLLDLADGLRTACHRASTRA